MMVERKEERKGFFCPYCDIELVESNLPLCQVCGVNIFYCPDCRQPLPRANKVCPHCGAKIKG